MAQQSGEDRFLNVWFIVLWLAPLAIAVLALIEIFDGDDQDDEVAGAVTASPTEEPTATAAELETPAPAVANDLIENAAVLSETGSLEADTRKATSSPDDPAAPCTEGELTNTVWFRYDADGLETAAIDTRGSGFDTVVAAYSGTPPDLAEVACDDDSGGEDGSSVLFLRGLPEQTYHIMVASTGEPAGGSLALDFTLGTFDDRNLALPIRGVVDLTASPAASTAPDDPEPSCAEDGVSATVWWGLISETAGTMTVDTSGSNYDTVVAVFARQPDDSLVEVGCNDDQGRTDESSLLSVEVDPLVAYFVMVAAAGDGPAGELTIHIEAPQ